MHILSSSPTIYPFGMNTQGGLCDLAVLALKKMAIKKSKNSWATSAHGRIETYSCLWSIILQTCIRASLYSRIEYYSCD